MVEQSEQTAPTGCCDQVKFHCNNIWCKPTSRCFKGFTILFGIWAVACLLLGTIIPPIIRAHGHTDPDFIPDSDHPDDTPEEIKHRVKILMWCTLVLALSFVFLSIASLFTCVGLKKREERL
jgi:hypothetical protein